MAQKKRFVEPSLHEEAPLATLTQVQVSGGDLDDCTGACDDIVR